MGQPQSVASQVSGKVESMPHSGSRIITRDPVASYSADSEASKAMSKPAGTPHLPTKASSPTAASVSSHQPLRLATPQPSPTLCWRHSLTNCRYSQRERRLPSRRPFHTSRVCVKDTPKPAPRHRGKDCGVAPIDCAFAGGKQYRRISLVHGATGLPCPCAEGGRRGWPSGTPSPHQLLRP